MLYTLYDPKEIMHPKPDLEDLRACRCEQCGYEEVNVYYSVLSNGRYQFTAHCMDCKHASGALPYLKDLKSIGETQIYFGKYRGNTLEQVFKEDPKYLDWCFGNLENEKFLGTLVLFNRSNQMKGETHG